MPHRFVALCLVLLVAAPTLSSAGSDGLDCLPGHRPGATLLLPYFEADVDDAGGRDTLFSVNNAAAAPVLVHFVVWTNWGVPVLSFDAAIAADGVLSLSARDLLLDGELPVTSLPAGMSAGHPGCQSPLVLPALDAAALATLLGQLRGVPDGAGMCAARPVEDGRLVTGSITVDVVNECSGAELRHPFDEGYFAEGGAGVAGNDNVLWGDFFLIDPSQDSAQGVELPAMVADAERFGPAVADVQSIYGISESNRAPMATRYRARFLRGGAFSGGTELIAWTSYFNLLPNFCDVPGGGFLETTFRDQRGDTDANIGFFHHDLVLRLRVGEDPLPAAGRFGTVEVAFSSRSGVIGTGEEDLVPNPGLLLPIFSAEGRYSAGLSATPVAAACP